MSNVYHIIIITYIIYLGLAGKRQRRKTNLENDNIKKDNETVTKRQKSYNVRTRTCIRRRTGCLFMPMEIDI